MNKGISAGAFLLLWLFMASHGFSQGLDTRLQLADPDRGRVLFGECRLCHRIGAEEGHRVGPNLQGIFGKVVGSQPGFGGYSPRFRESGFVWTPNLMYAWLENPMGMYPDSTMLAAGVADAQDRADLIAYLMRVTAVEPP